MNVPDDATATTEEDLEVHDHVPDPKCAMHYRDSILINQTLVFESCLTIGRLRGQSPQIFIATLKWHDPQAVLVGHEPIVELRFVLRPRPCQLWIVSFRSELPLMRAQLAPAEQCAWKLVGRQYLLWCLKKLLLEGNVGLKEQVHLVALSSRQPTEARLEYWRQQDREAQVTALRTAWQDQAPHEWLQQAETMANEPLAWHLAYLEVNSKLVTYYEQMGFQRHTPPNDFKHFGDDSIHMTVSMLDLFPV